MHPIKRLLVSLQRRQETEKDVKMQKKMNLTSQQQTKHRFASQNTQHIDQFKTLSWCYLVTKTSKGIPASVKNGINSSCKIFSDFFCPEKGLTITWNKKIHFKKKVVVIFWVFMVPMYLLFCCVAYDSNTYPCLSRNMSYIW